MQVGTLDVLVGLSDELAKLDSFVERYATVLIRDYKKRFLLTCVSLLASSCGQFSLPKVLPVHCNNEEFHISLSLAGHSKPDELHLDDRLAANFIIILIFGDFFTANMFAISHLLVILTPRVQTHP